MRITQTYTIDVISIVPDDSILYIQAPSVDESEILKLWQLSPFPYYKQILLSKENKEILISIIEKEEVELRFQSVELRFNDKLLYEGFDGMEYGEISKTIILPKKFYEDYVDEDFCAVSREW